MKFGSVLCPTDFSEFSRRAVEHAIALARCDGAKLTFLHVYPFLAPLPADAPYFPSGLPLVAEMRARLVADLGGTAEGDPSEEILRQARTLTADLIVMGTHGRRGFDGWMLGSVADRVVHKARCAVLTVPRPPEGAHPTPGGLYERILCPVELSGSETILEIAFSIARSAGARLTLCGDPRRSTSDMTPPPGDARHGRAVFVDLRCHACHRVAGENFDLPVAEPPAPVVLGGRIARVMTDGALADSIVNPSRRIAYETSTGVRSGTLSRMPDYTRTMTVRELADLVAYLQTKYELVDPPVFSHY